jgi:phosphate transport system substrate-binding protein
MRKALLWLLWGISGCGPRAIIVMKGSDTVLPVSQALAEAYLVQHPEPLISITGGGSGVGIAALLNGDADIAMSSRPLKLAERLRFIAQNRSIIEDTLAWDVLAICVHPSNPISQLSREDLVAIYTGAAQNWKAFGGPDLPIVVYSRESSSGTFEFFRDRVLRGKDFAPSVRFIPATGTLVQSIAQTPGAIGYVGVAYLNPSIKAIALSDKGQNPIAPAKDRTTLSLYPLARPLYFCYEPKKRNRIRAFLDFARSAEGQALIQKVGFIP